jgi:cyclophilin family peptidyl-prolyl cis-trans isomerase
MVQAMRRAGGGVIRAAGVAVLVATFATPRATPDEARVPVPEPAARTPVVAELRKELKDELKSKDPEVRRKLARRLLERAASTKDDAVRAFVLLEQALTLAVEAGDVGLALDAVGRLAAAFEVERAARGLAAVETIARGTKEAGVLAEAADACVELAGEALAADDPATAAKAVASARSFAKTAKLGGLGARAAELTEMVGAYRKAAAAAEAARAALAAPPPAPPSTPPGPAPDPAAAHEAIGRHLAFGRGAWEEGLAELARGANAALAALAARDLERAAEPAARTAVADGWWELAQRERDPLGRARMVARAATAYEALAAEGAAPQAKERAASVTWWAWGRGIALTKDFSKDGPVSLGLATVRAHVARQKVDRGSEGWRTRLPRFPTTSFARGEEYLWRLETNLGAITLRLFPETAPQHVANILYLTEVGFFDGLGFHRVIPGFMAQGGCPKKDGTGNPGYTFDGEYGSGPKHDKRGVLSMANTGQANTDGSQFFITFRATPELDGKHTVFGEVVDGMDVLKKLEDQGTPGGPPKSALVIESARVSAR